MIAAGRYSRILAMALVVGAVSNSLAAEEGGWSVNKSSGEVWMTTTGAQPVSLGKEEVLKPGDSIRTGRNGRVLLVRGEETILVSPNSVIGLSAEQKEGLSSTIVQQAGSILLEVEKRNVKHFEVETPYLAAVVKGTQFRVSVYAASTSVDVIRGQVQVADFRSGQIAQVMPGQHATAFAHGNSGLSLSGSGSFSPIEHGQPRAPSIDRVPVPKSGLTAPRHAANGPLIRALGHGNALARGGLGNASLQRNAAGVPARHGVTRISSPLGEVRLNFHRVTHGLARGTASTHGATRHVASRDTVWSSPDSRLATGIGNGSSNSNDAGSNANAGAGGNAAAASAAAGAIAAAASPGGGNGNGNNGNGNGNGGGNGANGNGNGNGHGRGRI